MCNGGTVCMASELLSNLLCYEENLLCHEEGVGDDICAEGGDSLYTGNQGGGGILVTIFWTKSASNCEVYSSYNLMSSISRPIVLQLSRVHRTPSLVDITGGCMHKQCKIQA